MAKKHRTLIVSFIGNTDLECSQKRNAPLRENMEQTDTRKLPEDGPIFKLLLAQGDPQLFELNTRESETTLLLFDDDKPGKTERKEFCDNLTEILKQNGLSVEIERAAIAMPKGPTDLDALYGAIGKNIPTSGSDKPDQVIFHISSGTPAMKFSLLLASFYLPLKSSCLVETSRERGVKKVNPPFILAAKAKDRSEKAKQQKLPEKILNNLPSHTVIDDSSVHHKYATLYNYVSKKKKEKKRILVTGATGTGKWHACHQACQWVEDGKSVVQWTEGAQPEVTDETAILMIKHLDSFSSTALEQLNSLASERETLIIMATYRTDNWLQSPGTLAKNRAAMGGACIIELPSLAMRDDIIRLAEALAKKHGIASGKIKERLQLDLLNAVFPNNLHDLESLLITADAASNTKHPETGAVTNEIILNQSNNAMKDIFRKLNTMEFHEDANLPELLNDLKECVIRKAYTIFKTQDAVAKKIGISQTQVYEILKKRNTK